jgi:hypothetical protein
MSLGLLISSRSRSINDSTGEDGAAIAPGLRSFRRSLGGGIGSVPAFELAAAQIPGDGSAE